MYLTNHITTNFTGYISDMRFLVWRQTKQFFSKVLLLRAETGDRGAVVQSSLSHLTLKFQPNFSTKFRMPKDFWKAFNELKFKIGF